MLSAAEKKTTAHETDVDQSGGLWNVERESWAKAVDSLAFTTDRPALP